MRYLFMLMLSIVVLTGWGASPDSGAYAQVTPDYGALVGSAAGGAGDARPKAPDVSDYSRVAESYSNSNALDMTQQTVNVFRQRMQRILSKGENYFTYVGSALKQSSPNGEPGYFIGILVFSLILLVIGRAGSVMFGFCIGLPIMRRIQRGKPASMVDKLPVLAARVGLQVVGIAVTLLIAAAVGSGFYQEHEPTVKTVIVICLAMITFLMVDVLWRMLFSPFLPDYRIPVIPDRQALALYRWMRSVAFFSIVSKFYMLWLVAMDVSRDVVAFTELLTTIISALLLVAMVYRVGGFITSALLGGKSRKEATLLASLASLLWRPLVLVYTVVASVELVYRIVMGLEPGLQLLQGLFGVALAAMLVYAITIYLIEHLFRRARLKREANEKAMRAEYLETEDATTRIRTALEDVDADDGEEGGSSPVYFPGEPVRRRGLRTFEDLARRVASLFALGAGLYAMLLNWFGAALFQEGSKGEVAIDMIVVFLLGYIAFQAAKIWMDQKIEDENGDEEMSAEPGDEGGAAAAASRLGTILPLFRSFVLASITIASGFLVLMEAGVNIAPLLGGAGVVGLALGFGAQSLVRDILSGVFFLSDDAFRKGEYIDIGGVKGTVEKISLRSFQLRHHLGALNTVPFGEIQHLTNFSRDWVMMKLPLRLTYDTDVDKVRKLIKKLGQQLLEHPTEGAKFLQPLKSQGVYMMEDSAMIIRVKFMTRPGDQWTTRKLIYQELRALFEREGIKFAHKEVTVRIPEIEKNGGELPEGVDARAVGAAARRVIDDEGMTTSGPSDDR